MHNSVHCTAGSAPSQIGREMLVVIGSSKCVPDVLTPRALWALSNMGKEWSLGIR